MNVRARALLEAGEPKRAEGLLKRVVEADPKADAYANLGWVQWSRGHRKDAARSWQAALELDPTHERALYLLAALHLRELTENGVDPRRDGEAWETVRGLAERAGQAGAHNAPSQRLLATVANAMGDTATARAAQRDAERLDPGRAATAPGSHGLEEIRLPRVRQASQRVRTPPRFIEARGGQSGTFAFPVDLDGNGQFDLILGGSPFISWCDMDRADSSMRWQPTRLLEDPVSSVCSSLFDDDAALDLMVFTQAADSLSPQPSAGALGKGTSRRDTRVWLVRGGSRRPQTTWLFNLVPQVLGAQPLDADWDGDVDVVLAVAEAPGLRLLRNEGGGHFGEAVPLPGCAEFGPARDVTITDVDGDGRDDLIALDAHWRVRVFATRATGVFANLSTRSGLAGQRARVVRAADLDEDGRVDLLLGDDEGLWIWSSDDTGRFARSAAYRDALGSWSSKEQRGIPVAAIHLADLDNDGLLDVVTQHFASPPPVFATANQALDATEDTAPGSRRLEPLLDVPGWTRLAVWHNEGNLLFADVTAASDCRETLVGPASLASGDFNGDGAIDLVGAGADRSLLFLWSHGGTVHRRLELELVDPKRPSASIGARVELHMGTRAVHRTLRAPAIALGVLDAEVVDVLRVQWPDGTVQNDFDLSFPAAGRLQMTRSR